ncbi:hypothetical protein GGS23DRAFT_574900, partial [Durotheca rogersii]|uniref:uncharacterized protein n=1 Tax=Durotheca rogersii TaxID=419775 RepID=UPI00221E54F4
DPAFFFALLDLLTIARTLHPIGSRNRWRELTTTYYLLPLYLGHYHVYRTCTYHRSQLSSVMHLSSFLPIILPAQPGQFGHLLFSTGRILTCLSASILSVCLSPSIIFFLCQVYNGLGFSW